MKSAVGSKELERVTQSTVGSSALRILSVEQKLSAEVAGWRGLVGTTSVANETA